MLETPYYPHRVQETRQLLQDFWLEISTWKIKAVGWGTHNTAHKVTRMGWCWFLEEGDYKLYLNDELALWLSQGKH